MKKALLISSGVMLFGALSAQTLVGTAITSRQVVLEEVTGIDCPNCPDGHVKAMALYNAYPGKVNLINVHTSSYAVPETGEPEFRTPFGSAIQTLGNVTGVPGGIINRQVWPGAVQSSPYYPQNSTGISLSRGGWMAAGQNILSSGSSPVNIGVKTTWNATTRLLTVDVELYYTAAQTVNNEINVALTQSNIIGYQGGTGGGTNYNHKFVLRHLLTGQWGDVITTPTLGQLVAKTYTYTVPTSYTYTGTQGNATNCIIDDCDITVFVTKNDHKTVHTGITCDAKNGQGTTTPLSTGINEGLGLSNASIYPNPLSDMSAVQFSLESAQKTTIELYNVLGSQVFSKDLGSLNAGTHNFSLNSLYKEAILSKGIYLLKINAGVHSITLKITR